MLTAAVRDLHKAFPDQFLTDVRTACPALWEHNPHITPLDESDPSVRVVECHYPLIHQSNRVPYHFIHAFAQHLGEQLGIHIPLTEFRGDIHIADKEKRWMSQVMEVTGEETPFWIINPGGKYDYTIKWWDWRRYQQVVDHFQGRILFVQVGESGHYHPPLDGVLDLRGKTDLRQLTRLVYHSHGVLCGVTALMHLAAAVPMKSGMPKNRACVVVAGGREPMQWEAYPHHQYLHTNGALRCCDQGGCWSARTTPIGDEDSKDHSLCCAPVALPESTPLLRDRGFIFRSNDTPLRDDLDAHLPRCMDMITAADAIRAVELYHTGGALRTLTATEQACVASRVLEKKEALSV